MVVVEEDLEAQKEVKAVMEALGAETVNHKRRNKHRMRKMKKV